MIENFEQFLNSYGYFAVFIGTFLEGEFALLVAGFFIKHGFLAPLPTLIISIFGALVHELIFFFLGRWKGKNFLLRNKYTRKNYRKMKSLIQKHEVSSLFIIRFMYGMRVVPMMLMGAYGFNFYKFLFFNILSLIIWAILFLYIGYLFGHVATMLFGKAKHYFFIIGIVVAIIGLLIYLISFLYKKIKA
jgi:membrane protein DedA with SNARE-associated domain